MGMFNDCQELRRLGTDLKLPTPQRRFDPFLQTKVPRLQMIVTAASAALAKRGHNGGNPAAVDRLDKFVRAFQALDPATVWDDDGVAWDAFVRQFVGTPRPPSDGAAGAGTTGHAARAKRARVDRNLDWKSMLSLDCVLQLFGFTDDEAAAVRATPCEGTTVERAVLRWLPRALAAHGFAGCFGDVVNLAYAMLGADPPSGPQTENHTVDIIKRFSKVLQNGARDKPREPLKAAAASTLWIPTHLVHDGESDDIMTLLVLEHLHRRQGSRLRVLMQLPAHRDFDKLVARFDSPPHWTVFRDPDALNGEAIKSHFFKHKL
jgi:hypothetical protein